MTKSKLIFRIELLFKTLFEIYSMFLWRLKNWLLWDYYYAYLPLPKIKGAVPHDSKIQIKIKQALIDNNFNVIDYKIDKKDYLRYLEAAAYQNYSRYYNPSNRAKYFTEKSLEHYLAAKLLNLNQKDIYIDVANANSPTPNIYHKLYGCKIYRQDLWFPEGIHDNIIGGDASNMPVKDEFASKMALHCSFEHFEKDSDMKFIREASRVLKKGGKLCIIPLYLFNRYAIQTDPTTLPKKGIKFEKDAILYCAKGWKNRHGRHYDIPHLINRIQKNLKELKLTIFCILNEKEIDPSCYVKFIALFEKQ